MGTDLVNSLNRTQIELSHLQAESCPPATSAIATQGGKTLDVFNGDIA